MSLVDWSILGPAKYISNKISQSSDYSQSYGYDDSQMPENFSGTTDDWNTIVANNPYSYENFVNAYGQKPTWLEDLASQFGIRSNYDKLYGEWRTKSAEYFADALNSARAEDYNSEESSLARQRSAGLNPDINGTISNGSQAVPANGALGGLSNESANASNNFETLFSGISQVAMQVMQLETMGLGAESMDIANMSNLMDTATSYADKFTDIRSIASFLDNKKVDNDSDYGVLVDEYLDSAIKTASPSLSSLYGRRSRKKIKSIMSSYVSSADYRSKLMDQMRNYADKLPQAVADKKFLDKNDFGELISKPLEVVTTKLSEFNIKRAEVVANLAEADALNAQTAKSQAELDNSLQPYRNEIQSNLMVSDLINSETSINVAQQNKNIVDATKKSVVDIMTMEKDMQKTRTEGRKFIYNWLQEILHDTDIKVGWKIGATALVQVFENSINSMSFMDLMPKSLDFSRSYDNSSKNYVTNGNTTIQK